MFISEICHCCYVITFTFVQQKLYIYVSTWIFHKYLSICGFLYTFTKLLIKHVRMICLNLSWRSNVCEITYYWQKNYDSIYCDICWHRRQLVPLNASPKVNLAKFILIWKIKTNILNNVVACNWQINIYLFTYVRIYL